jgi:hypothetical protein
MPIWPVWCPLRRSGASARRCPRVESSLSVLPGRLLLNGGWQLRCSLSATGHAGHIERSLHAPAVFSVVAMAVV